MVNLTSGRRGSAVRVDAMAVPDFDGEALNGGWVAFRSSEFEDLASAVLEEVIEVGLGRIEQIRGNGDGSVAEDFGFVAVDVEHDHHGRLDRDGVNRSC